MTHRIYILALLLISALYMSVHGQSPIRLQTFKAQPPDSIDIDYYGKRHFLQGALTLVGLNTTVWAFDRYVQDADFAKISFKSIRDNLKEGFNWDNDRLGTNMFLHPYHGNLYYTCGRANGFNYWQSGLFAIAGSAMWELFMENEYPSTNDIIATPIGGMAIGEVTYRASDIVLKDNTRGAERFGREAAAFVISPMRGLTRIINGDAWRYRPTSGRQFGIPNIALELSLGIRAIGFNNRIFDRGAGVGTQLYIEYGDRFELRSTQPYDYFTFKLNLNFEKSQPLLGQLNIMGRLISREVIDTKHNDMSIGLYQHFDFYDSDTISSRSAKVPYKLGVPASLGAGLMYRCTQFSNITIDAYSHINVIMLGGILSDHYDINDRNYNLASGFSVKSGANMIFGKNKFALSLNYYYYRLYTWGYPRSLNIKSVDARTLNAEGDTSNAYFGIANIRADWRIGKQLFLTASFDTYMRATRYRDFPDVNSTSFASQLMMTYKF